MPHVGTFAQGIQAVLPEGGIDRLEDLVGRLVQLLHRADPDLPDARDYQTKLRTLRAGLGKSTLINTN